MGLEATRTIAVACAVIGAAFAWPSAAVAQTSVLLAAGDVAACTGDGDELTAQILDVNPGTVAVIGDVSQTDGSMASYVDCYDPTWGRHKARTRPAPGNHDYRTPGAAAYYAYFGELAGPAGLGYYSYDLGDWHIVTLNSNCSFVSCAEGSAQEQWLRADLAAHPAACTLAYWHHPRFSSGRSPQIEWTAPFWDALYEAGAEIVLAGHDHLYERFAPQTPIGDPNPAYRNPGVHRRNRRLRPCGLRTGCRSRTARCATTPRSGCSGSSWSRAATRGRFFPRSVGRSPIRAAARATARRPTRPGRGRA